MNIRFITPDLHGFLDYAAAAALIVLPVFLQLQEQSALVYWFSIAGGAGLMLYSLLTNYALGVKRIIPYRGHLLLDAIASIAFIALAFLHDGTAMTLWYSLIMGAGVVVVIALSPQPTVAEA
jgi:hypothetical protein